MQLKIEVRSTEVKERSGTSRAGKPYTMREQSVRAEMANGDVRNFTVVLPDKAAPYPLGTYTVHASSFEVNRFGSLEVGRLALAPVAGPEPGRKAG